MSNAHQEKCRFWGSARMTYTICAFVMMILQLVMRNTINMVVLCMFDEPATNATFRNSSGSICSDSGKTKTLDWSRSEQFTIQGSFYYGYAIILPIAGRIADKLGGKFLFIFSVVGQAIVFMLFPWLCKLHFYAAFAGRVIQGLIAGSGGPCLYQLFLIWAHPNERTALVSFAYGGFAVGSLISGPLSSSLCSICWEASFYIIGAVCLIVGISFNWLIYNTLAQHPRLSESEYNYLNTPSLNFTKRTKVPWKKIATSAPVYVFIFTHFCCTYGILVTSMIMPKMMKEIFEFTLNEVGLYSSSIFFGAIISKILIFFFSGSVEKLSNQTLVRRVVFCLSNTVTVLLLVGIVLCQRQPHLRVAAVFCVMGVGIFADIAFSCYWPSLLFLAPSYAGLLSGITNCLGSFNGFLGPMIISTLTKSGTVSEWNNVLKTITLSYGSAVMAYGLFGSSELQPWDGQ